jgi:hypothetical protein
MSPIRHEDIFDVDIIDAFELLSSGSTVIATDTLVSTVNATKRVTVSTYNLDDPDEPIEPGDIVVITGNAAAGTYHVASIISMTIFTVIESILSSTGGSITFYDPAGATKIGISPTNLTTTTATVLQNAFGSIDLNHALVAPPSDRAITFAATRTSGQVSRETWTYTTTSLLLKSIDYTRVAGLVTSFVTKIFAADGTTIIAQTTDTIARTGGVVTSGTTVRNV